MIFDTHAHYDDEQFNEDRVELLNSMEEQGVGTIINVSATYNSCRKVIALAKEYPSINYIGIERYSSVLLRALERFDNDEEYKDVNNIRFICMDATNLPEVFAVGEIDKIYLNFSDPWPKARHAKRRLTSKQFFERYDKILAFDGVVEFKTDNRELFDFSLEQVELAGWVLLAKTYDLHNDPTLSRGNVMTEYEEKFSGQGHPIHKLIAMRQ